MVRRGPRWYARRFISECNEGFPMTDATKDARKDGSATTTEPEVKTRWLDGSKFVDPKDLGKRPGFRKAVEAARSIPTSQASS